ncbi:TPA: HlyD family efflux transporter periplasmic adaptor subunit [Escherichia coli]|nr:HlyD family efflux transporter periplasmic adaptor subunit [Escherichia coli]
MANPNLNLVHENETQRRHARIKIPARLVVQAGQNEPLVFEVQDLSASGFSVHDDSGRLRSQQHYDGRLLFSFDNVEFALNVRFQVVNHQGNDGRFGCEFHDLGEQEVATLRLLITKFLGGEITRVGDVLSTMNRENFTKARKQQVSAGLSGWQRVRALVVTLCSLAIGIAALGYLASKIYESYFVTVARSAVVEMSNVPVPAAGEGNVTFLVKEGDVVKRNAPLAKLTSPLINLLPSVLGKTQMNADQLKALLDTDMTQVVNSPCDCRVQHLDAQDGVFVGKGDNVLTLVPAGSQPQVLARFDFATAQTLHAGTKVFLQLPGHEDKLVGTIDSLTVPDDLTLENLPAQGGLLAVIKPEKPLAESWLKQPVQVSVEPVAWKKFW